MCGIVAGWTNPPIVLDAIKAGLLSQRHRGPDDEGLFREGSAFLGIRRLSVIDVRSGHQPIGNEDGRVQVVLNGEIYNYRELATELRSRGHVFRTDSDTEVIVHLYEEAGEACVSRLRGMFAFAIWDSAQQTLFLARDRFGKKPLYYLQMPSRGIVFASEIKALSCMVQAAGYPLTLRAQSIYDYLSLAVVPQPFTIYNEVQALPPGSWMRYAQSGITTKVYWTPDLEHKIDITYAEAMERTRDLIGEATRLRLRSDVPVGIFLSGGIDSSVVAYEACTGSSSELHTFTISIPDKDFDESIQASKTALTLGLKNTVLPLRLDPLEAIMRVVSHYDQPFADPSAIPSMEVARVARQHVTVVLNGDGGDELFCGYRRHLAAHWARWTEWLPCRILSAASRSLAPHLQSRRTGLGFSARFVRGALTRGATRYLIWTTDLLRESEKGGEVAAWRGGAMRPTEEWIASLSALSIDSLDGLLRTDLSVNLLSMLLVKMDMATMASSVESRSPFLDHVLAEFAFSLPHKWLLRGGRTKGILRDSYRSLLPTAVTASPKRGFEIPLGRWLQQDLRPLLLDSLGSRSAKLRSYIDDRFLDDSLRGNTLEDRNWPLHVYSLLVLELWLRRQSDHARAC